MNPMCLTCFILSFKIKIVHGLNVNWLLMRYNERQCCESHEDVILGVAMVLLPITTQK